MTPEERRHILLTMGLITTADLLTVLVTSKGSLAKLRAAGLRQYGIGKQKFYRLSEVPAVLAKITEGEP